MMISPWNPELRSPSLHHSTNSEMVSSSFTAGTTTETSGLATSSLGMSSSMPGGSVGRVKVGLTGSLGLRLLRDYRRWEHPASTSRSEGHGHARSQSSVDGARRSSATVRLALRQIPAGPVPEARTCSRASR